MRKRLHDSRQTFFHKRFFPFFLIVLVVLFGFLFLKIARYAPVLWELLFNKEIALQKTPERDQVNILLLGIGGGKHDGPLLTDTIIFASIDPVKNKVTLVSIPRDLWVPELSSKINVAYASGEAKRTGGGLVLTKAMIERVLGQEVDYAVRLDFKGFVRAVDMVGGLDVNVTRGFEDPEYPISGKEADDCGFKDEEFEERATASSQLEAFPCRYETLRFNAGMQHMDGETALRFVRSRHAKGPEGTDFARSQRQEKIIDAFKDKVLSAGTFLNPIKLISLYDIFKDSIDTDITQDKYDDFIKLAQKMEGAETKSLVLDIGDERQNREGLLMNPPISEEYRNQWVIIPRIGNGNYSEIQKYINCEIVIGNCTVTPTKIPEL